MMLHVFKAHAYAYLNCCAYIPSHLDLHVLAVRFLYMYRFSINRWWVGAKLLFVVQQLPTSFQDHY